MSDATTGYDAIDFFRDNTFVADPYPYFDWLRGQCPVHREAQHDVFMVTGYDEAVRRLRRPDSFSSCNSVTGPFPGFPVPLEGRDDVSELIEKHRDELPFNDQLTTMDPPKHRDHRHLLMRLLTPKRLKENEEFMWRLADRQIDEFIGAGECEFIGDYANPFTLFVIADLLGVPEAEHQEFRDRALARRPQRRRGREHQGRRCRTARSSGSTTASAATSRTGGASRATTCSPRWRRRRSPTAPLPEVIDVVRVAANVFAAGQETTVRLLGAALQLIGERPDLQQALRDQRELDPGLRGGDAADRVHRSRATSGSRGDRRPSVAWTSRPARR